MGSSPLSPEVCVRHCRPDCGRGCVPVCVRICLPVYSPASLGQRGAGMRSSLDNIGLRAARWVPGENVTGKTAG